MSTYEVELVWSQGRAPHLYRQEMLLIHAANVVDLSEQIFDHLSREMLSTPSNINITLLP